MDLKLREREEQERQVRVTAVDCSPEALSVMCGQIHELSHTEVNKFLLDEVLGSPDPFDPPTDLVVTTPTHYEDLIGKMLPGGQPYRLVMSIATGTALELAALPPGTRLGIITASRRFSQVMLQACEKYGKLGKPVLPAFFGDRNRIASQIRDCDRLLLPPNYELFASPEEAALIRSCDASRQPIIYHYQIEQGSLLYLEEQIERIYTAKFR